MSDYELPPDQTVDEDDYWDYEPAVNYSATTRLNETDFPVPPPPLPTTHHANRAENRPSWINSPDYVELKSVGQHTTVSIETVEAKIQSLRIKMASLLRRLDQSNEVFHQLKHIDTELAEIELELLRNYLEKTKNIKNNQKRRCVIM